MNWIIKFILRIILFTIFWVGVFLTLPFRKTRAGLSLIKALDDIDLFNFILKESSLKRAIREQREWKR